MLTFVGKLVHCGYSSIAWIGASCRNYGRGYGMYSWRGVLRVDKGIGARPVWNSRLWYVTGWFN